MRPGPHPVAELARAALSVQDPQGDKAGDLGALLERSLRGDARHEKVVLVVDQLEELWTSCTDPGERAQFLGTVADLVASAEVLLVLVIRADFLTELAEHDAVASLVGDGAVLVAAPREAEVRRAVELPALRCGLELETGLLDAVVDDSGREPGVLPLLSTAMVRLWEQRVGRTLTLAAYVGQGGLSGAIARLAEEQYNALAPHERTAGAQRSAPAAGPGEGDDSSYGGERRSRSWPHSRRPASPRSWRSWPRHAWSRCRTAGRRSRTRRCSGSGHGCELRWLTTQRAASWSAGCRWTRRSGKPRVATTRCCGAVLGCSRRPTPCTHEATR